MSCGSKKEWIKIPDCNTPCVIEVAKDAVNQHNKASGDNLVFKRVIVGWFLEIDDHTIKHRLYIEVINSKGVVLIISIVIVVVTKDGKRVRTLVSSHHGYPDEKDLFIFWNKIPDVNQPCVQNVAKWAVNKHNKDKNDYLVYVSTVEGWYIEAADYSGTLVYKLHIKAKECIGRVRDYCAVVKEEKPLTERIRTLLEFFPIPPKK